VGQYRLENYSTSNGLPQNTISAITQTRDGYLWFATYDGLVRYDGVRFTIFDKGNSDGIDGNRLSAMCEDGQGQLWVQTVEGGIFRYREGSFTSFTGKYGIKNVGRIQCAQNGFPIIFMDNDKKGMWTEKDGLGEVEPRLLTEYVDRSKTRWVFDKDKVIRVKADGGQKVFPVLISSEEFLRFRYEDRAGNMWFGTRSDVVYQIVGENLNRYSKENGLPSETQVIIGGEDNEGNLWLSGEKELFRYKEGKFTVYPAKDYLNSNQIRVVFCDREGTIWVGTGGRGLYRLTREFLRSYGEKDGLLNDNVYPIYEDRTGSIWVGSNQSGMVRFSNEKLTGFPIVKPYSARNQPAVITTPADKREKANVQSFYEDNQGRLWVGLGGGLVYYKDGKLVDVSNMVTGSPDVIYQDRAGNLWFGTEKGLFKESSGNVKSYSTNDGLPNNAITVIHEDREGRFWVGTRDGFAKRDGERFIAITTKEGLAGNRVRSLYEDAEGVLWIGTFDSGLSRYKEGRFTNYTVKNGLFNSGVFAILEDGHGNFWMSSNRGIYRVSRQQLNDFAQGKISTIHCVAYGSQDGMLSTECNGGRQPAGVKARDGKLWFPTQGGVVVIDPETVPYNAQAPLPVIESVVVDRDKESLTNEVTIEPFQTDLEITYTAPSSIKAEYINFKYKLEGLNEEWIEAGTRRTVHYSHLPPGNYTFRVIAANSDGVWSESGTTLKVNMKPYFYQTRTFLILIGLSIIGIAILAYRYRVGLLHKRHEQQQAFSRRLIESQEGERKRIATGLHDSLGQQLLIIKNWVMLELSIRQESPSREALNEISTTATQAIKEVREIIYDLRPYQLDKIGLTSTIKSMVDKVAAASNIKFNIEVGDIDNLFDYDSEITLYRIVQECINNIIKHSEATEANVLIERNGKIVNLTIEDNGRGFSPDAMTKKSKTGGLGLTGMNERVRMLGGKQTIQSIPNNGTKITITIEIEKPK